MSLKEYFKDLQESAIKEQAKNNRLKANKKATKRIRNNGAPGSCPMCKNITQWKLVGNPKQGFSLGKAAVGTLLIGPVGVAGGALGKKKKAYSCGKCGFGHIYDK